MARYRTIKPELFADEKLTQVSISARFLFMGLLPFVDDMGRRQYSPRRIKHEVFPADNEVTAKRVASWLAELATVGVIKFYEDETEDAQLLWIPHFTRHQNIDRPSHSYLPAHPDDKAPDCRCIGCKTKAKTGKPNGQNVPYGTVRRVPSPSMQRALDEEAQRVGSYGSVMECSVVDPLHGESSRDIHIQDNGEIAFTEPETPTPQSDAGNRRIERAALDVLARSILQPLGIEANSNLITILAKSIDIRARSNQGTIEAAAAQILARAAFVSNQGQPESWEAWFFDSRYVYVPEGDAKLSDPKVWARPTCGGKLCEDGWEKVRIGEQTVLRRCPDCVKLWPE